MREDFEAAKLKFVRRFVDSHEPASLVTALLHFQPVSDHMRRSLAHFPRKTAQPEHLWLVLPFHPFWKRARIESLVDVCVTSPFMVGLWHSAFNGASPTVKVAWKNQLPSVSDLVACTTGGHG